MIFPSNPTKYPREKNSDPRRDNDTRPTRPMIAPDPRNLAHSQRLIICWVDHASWRCIKFYFLNLHIIGLKLKQCQLSWGFYFWQIWRSVYRLADLKISFVRKWGWFWRIEISLSKRRSSYTPISNFWATPLSYT